MLHSPRMANSLSLVPQTIQSGSGMHRQAISPWNLLKCTLVKFTVWLSLPTVNILHLALLTGKTVAGPCKGHRGTIYSVSFAPDTKWIASSSDDQTILIWDAQSGDLLVGPLIGHTDLVVSVAFSPDGKTLVSGSRDWTVRVWSVEFGRLILGPLEGQKSWVYFVAFSRDGKRIVSAHENGDVCVWNTDMGMLVSGPSKQHVEGTLAVVYPTNSTYYCAISPNGKWIARHKDANWSGVEIWDSKTGRRAATFSDHTANIISLSFSPDNQRMLTTSLDKTTCVRTLNIWPAHHVTQTRACIIHWFPE